MHTVALTQGEDETVARALRHYAESRDTLARHAREMEKDGRVAHGSMSDVIEGLQREAREARLIEASIRLCDGLCYWQSSLE
jgi:hypothetical protein